MELSFDSSSAFVPRTISDFIAEVSAIGDFSLRLSKLQGFVAKLEEEKRKIDAFKRELPISVLLVNEAIERLKERARAIEEGSESMIRETRAIEEFMPLKKKSASFDEEDEGEDEDEDDEDEEEEIGRANSESDDISDKRNWMSSAQLWSSNVDFGLKPGREKEEEDKDKEGFVVEGQSRKYGCSGGAFVPFKASSGSSSSQTQRLTSLSLTIPQISELGCVSSSLTTTTNSNSYSNSKTSYGNKNSNNNDNSASFRGVSGSTSAFLMEQVKLLPNKPQTQTQTQTHHQSFRKQRRCWSPELHRRFVDALQQLGGSQATPKQIRELMQVEGLTNDEVKSHLQKYRLHVRKLPNSQATQGNGDLWMTQQDHSGDNSKANMDISQSGSPQGPLLANGSHKALSNTGGDSTEGDEDDEKSDGHSWRGHGGNNNHQK